MTRLEAVECQIQLLASRASPRRGDPLQGTAAPSFIQGQRHRHYLPLLLAAAARSKGRSDLIST